MADVSSFKLNSSFVKMFKRKCLTTYNTMYNPLQKNLEKENSYTSKTKPRQSELRKLFDFKSPPCRSEQKGFVLKASSKQHQ